jgi:ribosomal protein L14E/L6E/L27E
MYKSLDDEYRVGQVVVSKRGKDAGQRYVIVGFLGEKRLALADADKFNVDRPKSKNPKHVTPTTHVMKEAAACVQAGKNINRGELCRFLESTGESKRRGRAANGE